ncbi:MAG: hypothetical protein NUV31_00385 [Dehalococcoidales bacterium]|jgi:hypothetical protein|nr:hypothetical protein [Dehalococcoidales bacterium]
MQKRILITAMGFLVGLLVWVNGCSAAGASVPSSSKTENLRLDSTLTGLIKAMQEGHLAEYARQHSITLEDGKIRVIVECETGQAGSVAQSINTLCTVESSYQNLLQVVVSPANLNQIALAEGVKLVRLPQPVLPSGDQQVN